MKKIIRIFLVEALVLYFVTQITTGIIFPNGTTDLLITAIGLTIASVLIKPYPSSLLTKPWLSA